MAGLDQIFCCFSFLLLNPHTGVGEGDSAGTRVLNNPFLWLFSWLPCDSDGKETACNVGDLGLILGSGRSAGNPLQYSFLENSVDRGAWWATQSMGSQRVRCHWATNTSLLFFFGTKRTNFVVTEIGNLRRKGPTRGVHVSNILLLHRGLSNLWVDPHSSSIVKRACFHFFFYQTQLDSTGAGLGS